MRDGSSQDSGEHLPKFSISVPIRELEPTRVRIFKIHRVTIVGLDVSLNILERPQGLRLVFQPNEYLLCLQRKPCAEQE